MPVKTDYLITHLQSVQKCPVVFIRMNFNFKLPMRKKKKKKNHTYNLSTLTKKKNGLIRMRALKKNLGMPQQEMHGMSSTFKSVREANSTKPTVEQQTTFGPS